MALHFTAWVQAQSKSKHMETLVYGTRDAQPQTGGSIMHPRSQWATVFALWCLAGWHRLGRAGGFQVPPSPTFCCSVAPTVEGWVAAGPSDDVLLQTQYQKGQNNAWLLHLPSVPAIQAQHLSLPLNAQPIVPSPCLQTCFSRAEAQAEVFTSKVLWNWEKR